jgi:thiamine pyrophosphokinase
VTPDAVIGDMDSIADLESWRAALGQRTLHIAEQETTDLEKCLYATAAPFYVGVGFLGGRLDHSLAGLHAMTRAGAPNVVLLGEADVVFRAPRRWRAMLSRGARVSFFPMTPTAGLRSEGLEWAIDGLAFAAGAQIGTSNRATDGPVAAEFDGDGMVVLLERRHLDAALGSLVAPR